MCRDGRHCDKIFFCRKFRGLNLPEKKAALKKLGACRKCLGCHDDEGYCRDTYLCRNKDCKKGRSSDHHYFLCPKGEFKRGEVKGETGSRARSKLTEEQEDFLAELSPELAEKCRRAFTNKIAHTSSTGRNQSKLLTRYGLRELPVLMMLMEVTSNAGQKVGTLLDLASDTNYITHKAADRLRLQREMITLVVHGVGGMTMRVSRERYLLRVRVKTSKGQRGPMSLSAMARMRSLRCTK